MQQGVKFRALPDSLMQIADALPTRQPRQASRDSVAAIRRSAEWIEDENLKAALLRLADSLRSN